MFAFDDAALDLGPFDVFRMVLGRSYSVHGEVTGLRMTVVQNGDGAVNVSRIGSHGPPGAPPTPEQRRDFEQTLRRLRADFALRDARIDVLDPQGRRLESIRGLDATVDKRAGSTDFDLRLAADLLGPSDDGDPGRVELSTSVDGTLQRPLVAQLTAAGLDLARYRGVAQGCSRPTSWRRWRAWSTATSPCAPRASAAPRISPW